MKRVSIILTDWSVRDSFHSIIHLNRQTVPRDDYEIIWVEYYDRRPKEIDEYVAKRQVDKWIVLNKTGMYFKHLLFNEGVLASEGQIIVIPDSDAIFSPTFVESIVRTFDEHKNEGIVLYLDELRSNNKAFYPYPFEDLSWDAILKTVLSTPGLWNWDSKNRKPSALTTFKNKVGDYIIPPIVDMPGIPDKSNYGACFCATRQSIIEAGGIDEDESYHCLTCGAYELGWRLVSRGFSEIWHQDEWLIHLWHPGSEQADTQPWEVKGDHIRGFSKTTLAIRETKRIIPLVENEKIRALRLSAKGSNRIDQLLVSIVVACVDMFEVTKKCIELIWQNTPPIFELIIVADKVGSKMKGWLSCLEKEGKAMVIINPQPVGAPTAFNMGIKVAKGEYIVLINNDIEVSKGWLEPLLQALKTNPQYGWVASRVIFNDTVMTFGSACDLFSREALERVGLLDEFFSGGIGADDDDMYRRFLLACYEPHGIASSVVYHPHAESTFQMLYGDKHSPSYLEKYNRNRQLLLSKWGTWGTNWDLIPCVL